MNSLFAKCFAGVVIAALLCAAGFVLLNRRQAPPLAAAEVPQPTAQGQPESTPSTPGGEAIIFPREAWEPAGLAVQTVTTGPISEAIELTGKITLNEDRLAHVFPLVEGRVDEVKVRFGQRVAKDELLVVVQSKEVGQGMLQLYQDRQKLEFARIKDRWTTDVRQNTQAMIEMMKAGDKVETIEEALKDRPLGEYRQSLMTAYVDHLKAKNNLERLSPLSPSGAVPGRQILDAEADLKASRATLQSLWEQFSQDTIQAVQTSAQNVRELETNIAVTETNLKILGLDQDSLRDIDPAKSGEQLAHYPVRAPFDGTVISKDVVLLERVGPEQPIATIADLSTVWVTADIYETHLPVLSRLDGTVVKIHCDAWKDREFEARVFYTGDVVQETTRTIAMRAAASNPDGLLKPGMFVTVTLPPLSTEDVVQAPAAAIQDHEGKSFVFIQTGDDAFVRRDIEIGRKNKTSVEIKSGLKAGDRLVVNGGFALKSRMLADLLAE